MTYVPKTPKNIVSSGESLRSVSFRIRKKYWEYLKLQAEKHDLSVSDLLNEACRAYIEFLKQQSQNNQ